MSRNPLALVDSAPHEGEVTVSGAEAHHLTSVLRARVGYEFVAFDGFGCGWQAKVVSLKGKMVVGRVVEPLPFEPLPPVSLTLGVGVVKGQHMDYAVEKAAETGVARFVPLLTDFGVIMPGAGKSERWRSVALAAIKQCRRFRLMEIAEPTTLRELCQAVEGRIWALVCGKGQIPMTRLWRELRPVGNLTLVIGPEGGFSDPEMDFMREKGMAFVSIGSHPLRTETAAVAAAALVENLAEEEGSE